MHKILLDLDAIVVRSSAGLVCDIWHHCCEVRTNIRIHVQRFRQTWPKTLRVDTSKKRVSENGQTDTPRKLSPVGTGKQPVLQKQEWNMDLAAAKQGVRSGPQTRYHLTLHLKCSTKSATVPWFHAIDKLIAHYSFVISSVWRNIHDFDCRLVQTISDSLTLLVIFLFCLVCFSFVCLAWMFFRKMVDSHRSFEEKTKFFFYLIAYGLLWDSW